MTQLMFYTGILKGLILMGVYTAGIAAIVGAVVAWYVFHPWLK